MNRCRMTKVAMAGSMASTPPAATTWVEVWA